MLLDYVFKMPFEGNTFIRSRERELYGQGTVHSVYILSGKTDRKIYRQTAGAKKTKRGNRRQKIINEIDAPEMRGNIFEKWIDDDWH